MKLTDSSGSLWATAYEPVATFIMKKSAEEVKSLKDNNLVEF